MDPGVRCHRIQVNPPRYFMKYRMKKNRVAKRQEEKRPRMGCERNDSCSFQPIREYLTNTPSQQNESRHFVEFIMPKNKGGGGGGAKGGSKSKGAEGGDAQSKQSKGGTAVKVIQLTPSIT